MAFFKEYGFRKQRKDGQKTNNYFGKGEDDYNIFIELDPNRMGRYNIIKLIVIDPETNEVSPDIPVTELKIKYNWKPEKIAKKINSLLKKLYITLSNNYHDVNRNNDNNADDEADTDDNYESYDNYAKTTGFSRKEIINKSGEITNDKNDRQKYINAFLSAFNKLTPEEQEFFKKLR